MMYVCVVFILIGVGFIMIWEVDIGISKWIGYQVFFGIGFGVGMQQVVMVVQIVLFQVDVVMGVVLMFFCQNFGGVIWICFS